MRPRSVWIFAGLVVLVGVVLAAVFARSLLASLTIAGLLAYLLDPLVTRLQRWSRLNRTLAAGVVYALTLLLLVVLVGAFGALVWGQLPRLGQELEQALTQLGRWLDRPLNIVGLTFYPDTLLENLQGLAGNTLTSLPGGPFGFLGNITANLLWSTLVLVSLYYFLKDGPNIKPWLVSWLPPQQQSEGKALLDEIDLIWTVFLRMQLLIFAILTLLFVSSTLLIIWLFRSGWLPLSPIGLVILFVLVYTAIQQVDNLWLRPQLLGRSLQLHPGVVFTGLIAALALSGILGAIVVVPLMATIKIIANRLHGYFVANSAKVDNGA